MKRFSAQLPIPILALCAAAAPLGCSSDGQLLLKIGTTELPLASVGEAYQAQIVATGGSGEGFNWRISAGALPQGLQLQSGSPAATISGTPEAAGSFDFTLQVVDDQGNAASQPLTLLVQGGLQITTDALPEGALNAGYSAELVSEGGTGAHQWSVTAQGELPPGLSINSDGSPTATIEGDPQTIGTFVFEVLVEDEQGEQATRTLFITISEKLGPLTIDTQTVPNAELNAPYTATIEASGGAGQGFQWSVSSGQLPPGLSLRMQGTPATFVSGAPTQTGSFEVTIQVTDARGNIAERNLTFDVAVNPLLIETDVLPEALVNEPYAATITGSGGSGAGYQWAVTQGVLPPGLILTPDGSPTTVLSGTPTAPGVFGFTVSVTDDEGNSETADLTVVVVEGLQVQTATLAPAFLNFSYTATISAAGGSGAGFTWSVAQGSLPPGLQLAAQGTPGTLLSGTPTQTGSFPFTVQVQDDEGRTATQALTLEVVDNLVIITQALPDAFTDATYNQTLTAGGGTASGYQWTITAGQLPDGLVLTSSGTPSVALSGTPTTPGTYSFSVTVTDDGSEQASQPFTVRVADPLQIVTTDLPSSNAGQSYDQVITAQGGLGGAYTWTVTQGALPPGLQLSALGTPSTVISGITTTEGTYDFTISVDDGAGGTASQAYTVVVANLQIVTANLPAGTAGQPYLAAIAAQGGATPYTWAVTQGALPPGLSIVPDGSPDTTLSGTPARGGAFSFRMQVTDAMGNSATRDFTVNVDAPIRIATGGIPSTARGTPYDATVTAIGGVTPYSWTVSAGALPPGLALTSGTPSATLFGSATSTGTFSFELTVDDGMSTDSKTFVVHVRGDARWVAFVADGITDNVFEAFVVDVSGAAPGAPIVVNPQAPFGDVALGDDSIRMSPDNSKLAFIGDFDTSGVNELYVVDLSGVTPGVAQRVNGTLVAGGAVSDFRWSPTSEKIAYIADQDIDTRSELYVVDLGSGAPSASLKVSGNIVPNGDVEADDVFWSPNGQRLAYVADQNAPGVFEVFTVDLSNLTPGPAVQVNPAAGPASDVDDFVLWTPDSRALIINSDHEAPGVDELYHVDVTTATVTVTKLNAPLVFNGDVRVNDYRVSPDGTKLIYTADQETNESDELYLVDLSGAVIAPAVKLNNPMSPAQDIFNAQWSADSTKLVYVGDQDTDNQTELFLVDFSQGAPSAPIKLNGVLPPGGDVGASQVNGYRISPDGTKVIYRADQDTDTLAELYLVDISGAPGAPMKLNQTLPNFADVETMIFSPDSSWVAYRLDFTAGDVFDLFVVNISGAAPTAPQQINTALPFGADVAGGEGEVIFSRDGSAIYYEADQVTNNVAEVWCVDLSGAAPGAPAPINPPLPPGGDVSQTSIQP